MGKITDDGCGNPCNFAVCFNESCVYEMMVRACACVCVFVACLRGLVCMSVCVILALLGPVAGAC